ncbi:MAG: DUF2946 family protein [Burkholderiales bacterium]|nr:DUF2946 family protein [Burkholderiales bacterium]
MSFQAGGMTTGRLRSSRLARVLALLALLWATLHPVLSAAIEPAFAPGGPHDPELCLASGYAGQTTAGDASDPAAPPAHHEHCALQCSALHAGAPAPVQLTLPDPVGHQAEPVGSGAVPALAVTWRAAQARAPPGKQQR